MTVRIVSPGVFNAAPKTPAKKPLSSWLSTRVAGRDLGSKSGPKASLNAWLTLVSKNLREAKYPAVLRQNHTYNVGGNER